LRLFICTISVLIYFFSAPIYSKVDPPNYNFSLDGLKPFYPGQKYADLSKTKLGKGELYTQNGKYIVYKYKITRTRYKFTLFIQVNKEDEIVDFYALLPSYFLHDVFHQSLINRFGKQNTYKKNEGNAVYIWNKPKNLTSKIIYSGTCTVTCFPLFISFVSLKELKNQKSFKSILDVASAGSLFNL